MFRVLEPRGLSRAVPDIGSLSPQGYATPGRTVCDGSVRVLRHRFKTVAAEIVTELSASEAPSPVDETPTKSAGFLALLTRFETLRAEGDLDGALRRVRKALTGLEELEGAHGSPWAWSMSRPSRALSRKPSHEA